MARKKEIMAATKTIRTKNSTDFGIDFWAQFESMSANAFIDVACAHYCDHLAKKHGIPWREIWHIDESVRVLNKLKLDPAIYPLSDEEQAQRFFVLRHREFFYDDDEKRNTFEVNTARALSLFPRLAEFQAAKGDHWAPGRAMVKALKERGLPAPEWPPKDAK